MILWHMQCHVSCSIGRMLGGRFGFVPFGKLTSIPYSYYAAIHKFRTHEEFCFIVGEHTCKISISRCCKVIVLFQSNLKMD